MYQLYYLAALLVFGLSNCQRSDFQPQAIDQDYITLGKGGGMTNQVITYYVLQDGRVFRHNSLNQEQEDLLRLKKPMRKAIFTRAQALPPEAFGCEEPGNIYYFLTVHSDTVRQCTWGSANFTPSPDMISFYDYVHEQIAE